MRLHVTALLSTAACLLLVLPSRADLLPSRTHEQEARPEVQTRICQYKYHKGLVDFGGDAYPLGNGLVECNLYDNTNLLTCMAVMKYENVSVANGTSTYHELQLVISGQGCWSWHDNYKDPCGNDTCIATMTKNGGPTRESLCCCQEDKCNARSNLQYMEYVEGTTLPGVKKDDDADEDSRMTTIVIIATIFILLLFSAVCIVFYYVYRKRRQATERALQLKVEQYNYEMRMYKEPPVVNFDDMTLDSCLHRGRFGDVYKAKLNDNEVCVKYFHAQQRPLFYTEKEIYGVLDPNVRTVVKCFACDERSHPDGTIQYIVIMEYVSLGSLAMYLKTHTLNWREFCGMAQSAAAGIGYLHGETLINGAYKHAIVHRDINSRNILVRSDMTCAIADMGFSMKIRGSKVIRNGVEEHAEDGSLRDVGTVRYMAPEILDCAVNLRDCESSLKQIDMYAYSLVLWELVTRCKDILFETKRFMLPYEEELGTHPSFEAMRVHVAKENHRPDFPVNMKHTEATKLIRDTIEECWDTDAEARLSALCVEERFKDIDTLMEHKGIPGFSKNDTCNKHYSTSSTDMICRDFPELSPLLETDTPGSESNVTTVTNLDTPEPSKPDVNIEMDRDRLLGPTQGRNIIAERNTLQGLVEEDLAVHENTLIPLQEARARQAAEDERVKRRQWEEQQQTHIDTGRVSRPPTRSVQLDVHNEVRDQPHKVKENNLNVRRHNSQRNLNESSTSSNGGSVLTIPDCSVKPGRPKSLNLNIKPESS